MIDSIDYPESVQSYLTTMLCAALLALSSMAWAQSSSIDVPRAAAPPVETDASGAEGAGAYVIRSVDFHVTGRSRPFVLRRTIDPFGTLLGSSFPDKKSLETFIADRCQVLLDERVIASAAATFEAAPADAGGYDVALHFETVDTLNIVALPYPKYTSNTGLDFGLRGRDYNFFGSLQPLELNLDYFMDTLGQSAFGGHVSFNAPFQLFGLDWYLGFIEDGKAWYGMGTPPASVTSMSLAFNLPVHGWSAAITATQGLSVNANGIDPTLPPDPDPWFLTETFALTATIPLGFGMMYPGTLTYTPSVSVSVNWNPGATLKSYGREGVTIALGNRISFGRVDWAGNLRQGFSFSVTSNDSYNTFYNDFVGDINLSVEGFASLRGWIGLAAQLTVFDRFAGASSDDQLTNLGSNMRGILDARMAGFQAAFVNLSVPLKLFLFPTHLVIGKDWLDFELQAQPFIDAGLLRPVGSSSLADWLWCSGGLEILVYPTAFRSFIVRASAGWDLKNVLATHSFTAVTPDGYIPYELFIGLGLMY